MLAAFSLDTSPLSAETRALAEREIRETPEQVQKSLAELRQLLQGKWFIIINIYAPTSGGRLCGLLFRSHL